MESTSVNVEPTTLHRILFEAGKSNNFILSKDDTVLAKHFIHASECLIVRLETAISRERRRIERLQTAIAPHKVLPWEVLRHIFKFVSSDKKLTYPFDVTYPPFIISKVCASWRHITRTDTQFWDHVVFTGPFSEKDSAPMTFMAKHILHPSQPVSFEVYNVEESGESQRILHQALVLPLCRRLRSLKILQYEELFAMPKDSFPCLEVLTLHLMERKERCYSIESSTCFFGMDNLFGLSLTLVSPFEHHRTISLPTTIPWKTLTSLELAHGSKRSSCVSLSTAIAVLKQCNNLRACTVHICDGEEVASDTIINLPRLIELKMLHTYNTQQNTSLVDFLIVPALRSLTILAPLDVVPLSLSSFIMRSRCRLLSLSLGRLISNRTFDTLDAPTLVLPPSLIVFDAPSIHLKETSLSQIAEGQLLPNIRSLRLTCTSTKGVEILTRLVERRRGYVSSLDITLSDDSLHLEFNEKLQEYLRRVKVCGARLIVRHGSEFLS